VATPAAPHSTAAARSSVSSSTAIRHSLTDGFGYSENRRRTIQVDARAIRELLGKVYGGDALLAEIAGTERPSSGNAR
jgi:hypothetical protein